MKFVIIIASLVVAASAGPERQRRSLGWGHDGAVVLGGWGLGPGAAIVGPVSHSVGVVGPVSPPVAVVGPVAGSTAVVGPSAGHTTVVGPSAGHAAVVGAAPGIAVVAGPSGVISTGGHLHF